MRELELLAPAKDKETAIAAIDHGADAVYIGAPMFGARAVAAVSVEDIAEVCRYAHLYRAKVYVALNTILYDHELATAVRIIQELNDAGVDALIIQDRALLDLDLPPIPLHASTQCDNRLPEQVAEWIALGIRRVVLARELTLEEIAEIAKLPVELEAFVHGALCVSYSGLCYLSQALMGRSANRGECAQLCRIPYTLTDANGQTIGGAEKHWLSLKDMNRLNLLSEMAEAGVTSFKIEGRLKPISYVKNVTASYHQALCSLIQTEPEQYRRSSFGQVSYSFTPDVERSFNRGFTSYLMKDRSQDPIASPLTPKSRGRYVGRLVAVQGSTIRLDRPHQLSNGDGLLLISRTGKVEGTQVIGILDDLRCRVDHPEYFSSGSEIYCNRDLKFEKLLSKPSASRRIPVRLKLTSCDGKIALSIEGPESYNPVTASIAFVPEKAERPNPERLVSELGKLGQTPLIATEVNVTEVADLFIPVSILSALRREATDLFCKKALEDYPLDRSPRQEKIKQVSRQSKELTYMGNVANSVARRHYENLGYRYIQPAFELEPKKNAALMTCKYCIKRELGHCPRLGQKPLPYIEPLYLKHSKGALQLFFDCKNCRMLLYQA